MKSAVLRTAALVFALSGWSRSAVAEPPAEPVPLIELYGTIVPWLEYGHTTGATAPGVDQPGRFRIDMGTSNLGFRGGVELMPDLSVVWQIESGVQTDGTPVANTIASRNSQIGVTGGWGTAFIGQWDTPYKWSTLALVNPIRAGFVPDYNGVLNTPGFGVSAVTTQTGRAGAPPDAAFDRRQGNSVQYWSPTLSGFSVRLLYSLNEGRTARSEMATSINPSIFGASVGYDLGPLKLRDAFEAHLDYFGMSQIGGSPGATTTNRSSTDLGNKVIASYTNAADGFDTRVTGVFEYLKFGSDDSMTGAIDSYSRSALYGLVDQTLFGKHHLWLAVGQALAGSCELVGGGDCTTEGLGANEVVLGYIYRVSKSTDFFAAGYRISNNDAASYSTFPPLGGPAAPGAAVEAFGIGMLYTFSTTLVGSPSPGGTPASPPPAPAPAPAPNR
ncbi:MAG TPA: porin [Kofleriaceae bacterium]|nr:porin [Kofleriaceae bacterium]